MKEQELIQQLLQRNDSALEQLQLHYGPLIRYIIAPILSDQRDREEAFSDVILRVWDRVDQYDPQRGSWTAWLSTLSRNAAIDRARKIRSTDASLPDTMPSPHSDPELALLRKEKQEALKRAIGALSYEDQMLFYRKYYYRQSMAQIAAERGMTERAVEGRLYRIKQKLRRQLGGEGFE